MRTPLGIALKYKDLRSLRRRGGPPAASPPRGARPPSPLSSGTFAQFLRGGWAADAISHPRKKAYLLFPWAFRWFSSSVRWNLACKGSRGRFCLGPPRPAGQQGARPGASSGRIASESAKTQRLSSRLREFPREKSVCATQSGSGVGPGPARFHLGTDGDAAG